MNTCRFCHDVESDPRALVHYSTRHFAHWECYLDAGKALADLRPWQRNRIPLWVVRNRPEVRAELKRLDALEESAA